MPAPPLSVEIDRRAPSGVGSEFARRHRVCRAEAQGSVLDLDDREFRRRLHRALDTGTVAELVERDAADTVISVARLVEFADLSAAVSALVALTRPGGTLEIVEPMARPGLVGLLLTSFWTAIRPAPGVHLGRDLGAVIGDTDLHLLDVEWFRLPTRVGPWRHAVAYRLRRPGEDHR